MEKLNNIFFTLMARGPEGLSYTHVILCVNQDKFGHIFADGYLCLRNDYEVVCFHVILVNFQILGKNNK